MLSGGSGKQIPIGTINFAFDGLIDEFSLAGGYLALEELQPLWGTPAPGPFDITGLSVNLDGDALNVTFETNERLMYDVQATSTLNPSGWMTMKSFIGGTVGEAETTLQYQNLTGHEDGTFTRIKSRLPSRP